MIFLTLIIISVLGVVAALRIPLDRLALSPSVVLHVRGELPGIDADTVEARVTIPLEQTLTNLAVHFDGVTHTRYGAVDAYLRFSPTVDRGQTLTRVRTLLARNRSVFPAGMAAPTAAFANPEVPPAAVYAITSGKPSDEIVRWTKNVLVDPLREVPEVASVQLDGVPIRTIRIQPEPRRMAGLGLSFDDIIEAVRSRDLVPRKSRRAQVVTPGSAESIAARAVRLPGGESIALAEVASVAIAEQKTVPARGAEPLALRLAVYPRTSVEAAQVAERTHAHLAWLRANDLVPPGANIRVVHDESRARAHWLENLLLRGALCIAVVLAIVATIWGERTARRSALAFAVWVPVSVALLNVPAIVLSTASIAGVILAVAPFAVILVSRFRSVDLWGVVAVGVLAWFGGIAWTNAPQTSAAFGIALLAASLIRWLFSPWLAIGAVSPTGGDESKVDRWHRLRAPTAGRVTAVLMLVTVGATVYSLPLAGSGASGGAFDFRLRGGDPKELRAVVEPLLVSLHVIPDVRNIVSSLDTDEEWRLKLDPQRLQVAGVSLAEVGRAFAIASEGLTAGEIVNADRQLVLRVQLAPGAAGDAFARLLLRGETANRPAIYLRDVGIAEKVSVPRERLRVDGQSALEITAAWNGKEARDALENFCDRVDVPAGYRLDCRTTWKRPGTLAPVLVEAPNERTTESK